MKDRNQRIGYLRKLSTGSASLDEIREKRSRILVDTTGTRFFIQGKEVSQAEHEELIRRDQKLGRKVKFKVLLF